MVRWFICHIDREGKLFSIFLPDRDFLSPVPPPVGIERDLQLVDKFLKAALERTVLTMTNAQLHAKTFSSHVGLALIFECAEVYCQNDTVECGYKHVSRTDRIIIRDEPRIRINAMFNRGYWVITTQVEPGQKYIGVILDQIRPGAGSRYG
ncbi:hypothetical protein EMPG_10648 [Blastomyces silverae]|uniref:Uncharacterized protein n=1 Tax=Blastomyces silverae TaxID=2060906 RepID=A0A0H1B3J0_9EURO|nr:hypothetical protein EMPG_10648 [Blastomyces silverae]